MKMYKLHLSILDRFKNNVKSILLQDTFVIPSQLSKIVVIIILRTILLYNLWGVIGNFKIYVAWVKQGPILTFIATSTKYQLNELTVHNNWRYLVQRIN